MPSTPLEYVVTACIVIFWVVVAVAGWLVSKR